MCQTKITAECQSRIHDDKLKRSVLSARQTLNGRLKIRLLWARGTFHAFPLRKFGMDGTHSEWLVFLFEKKEKQKFRNTWRMFCIVTPDIDIRIQFFRLSVLGIM